MNPAALPHTTSLVRHVRNRLWLRAGLMLLARGLWIGTAILLAGGLLHLLARPLPGGILLLLALLPPGAALLNSLLWQRPTTGAAARRADGWCDGHNLITSAWELRPHGARTPAAELVLARAEAVAPAWRERISREQALHWPRRITAALLLAATGFLLLQLPSKGWLVAEPHPLDQQTGSTDRQGYPALRRGPEPASRIPAAPQAEPGDGTTGNPRGENHATDSAPVATEAAADSPSSRERPPAPAPQPFQARINDGGSGAGDRPGQRLKPYRMDNVPLEVSEQSVARHGEASARGDDSGIEPGAAGIATPLPPVSAVAAAQPADQTYRADFSPALRHYIARYFEELRSEP